MNSKRNGKEDVIQNKQRKKSIGKPKRRRIWAEEVESKKIESIRYMKREATYRQM
jgi:hypothetical protein